VGGPFVERLSGRLLCYVAPHNAHDLSVVVRAAALTGAHPASGLVVRGRHAGELLGSYGALSPPGAARQPVVVDPGHWTTTVATPAAPLGIPADEDVLFPLSLDEQLGALLDAGADGVLTPSGFVQSGDWPALQAVLAAGAQVTDPRVATLIATDVGMLDRDRLATFLRHVDQRRGGRRLGFVFASTSAHLAGAQRMAGLRTLLGLFPGSLVLSAEVLTATDVLVHGGTAAIGLKASQRKPRPPGKSGGGPQATGHLPGMFLRELWETRSPAYYVDWFRNRPAPSCPACGRGPGSFTADQADKDAILLHNVHTWLEVLTDLRQEGEHARTWLSAQRWWARQAHRGIGPPGTGAPVVDLLQALCDLDGPPQQRELIPTR